MKLTRILLAPLLGNVIAVFFLILPSFQTATAWKVNTEPTHDEVLLGGSKKIVFLAGPHNSAYMSVKKYIANWAIPFQPGHARTKALSNWRWAGEDIHKLILESDRPNKEVWDEIKEKFEEDQINGVIVGSAYFDQLGSYAAHDALPVMKKIMESLGVKSSDVTVLLTYRTPRLDQWTSMWKHADGDYRESTYTDWLCDTQDREDEKKKRLDMLAARTNPLGAASEYVKQGWDVKMVETTGMNNEEINIVQVLVCQILQGHCVDGRIYKHEYVANHENEGDKLFTELNDTDIELAEDLFRFRDCAYESDIRDSLSNGKIELLYNHSMFAFCTGTKDSYYQRLAKKPEVMYSALLSQLSCPETNAKRTGKTMGQALGIEEEPEEDEKEKEASGARKGTTGKLIVAILLVALIAYQVYKINLKRQSSKTPPTRNGITIETLEMDNEKDSEMVSLNRRNGGKPNID